MPAREAELAGVCLLPRYTMTDPAHAGQETLARIVRDVGVELGADRCWVYARHPRRRRGIAVVRWLRSAEVTDVPAELADWADEAPDLPDVDRLFARALAGEPLDVVDDALAGGCNPALERVLGHRAFLHVNLHLEGVLWGTVQPGMTAAPRRWSERDRELLTTLRPALSRMVAELVRSRGERLRSRRLIGAAPRRVAISPRGGPSGSTA
jgi:GAF domain-containing protein